MAASLLSYSQYAIYVGQSHNATTGYAAVRKNGIPPVLYRLGRFLTILFSSIIRRFSSTFWEIPESSKIGSRAALCMADSIFGLVAVLLQMVDFAGFHFAATTSSSVNTSLSFEISLLV